MIPFSTTLPKSQLRDLRALARARGVTVASLVREAINVMIEEARSEIPAPEPDPRQETIQWPPTG